MNKKLRPTPDEVLHAAIDCHEVIKQKNFAHTVTGGLAVYLHSNTNEPRDVDLLVPDENTGICVVGTLLVNCRKYKWDEFRRAVLHPNGVRIDVHWDGKGNRLMPYPILSQITELRALPVLSLVALIESKLALARGEESKHTRHVRALIRTNSLDCFAVKNLQPEYREPYLALFDDTASDD